MSSKISYTASAICAHHGVNKEILSDMVYWGVATPYGETSDRWIFSQSDYERIACASRFVNDYDLNIAGSAMVLDLLQELDKVRIEIKG